MTLVIEGVAGFEEKQQLSLVEAPAPVKVYNCYFIVEELVKVPGPATAK